MDDFLIVDFDPRLIQRLETAAQSWNENHEPDEHTTPEQIVERIVHAEIASGDRRHLPEMSY